LIGKDGKGCIVCADNFGGMGVVEDWSSGNFVSKRCSCMLCQSCCMVEFKKEEEQKIKMAARWADVEGYDLD